ncbi:efflux RND transporter periplasmic adaptor subunit [Candidatus Uabimicrobium amorphum]|uniref:Hemolysin D n=1 Tax=Uabimicrobium amorphum TaxID=2596890 RepID=A0A5S9ITN2_UABAM|nr:HlyD family efflux transporter periplasmic adaptor subunit [Candidatus Uabimicrobium amorphum]BBM86940.1 hemolysin D [Candidatus Uabimicrobium amorphum]
MENTHSKIRIAIKYTIHITLTVVIITMGYFTSTYLMKSKPKVRKRKVEREAFVKTVTMIAKDHATHITAMGNATPSQRIDIFPQIGGRILKISSSLVPGGFLKQGTTIARIDPITEQRNVAEAKAQLAIAKARLRRAQRDYTVEEQRLAVEQKKANATLKSAQKQYENALQQSQRQEQLLQRKLTSEEVYELAKTTTIQKSAELETARLRLNELKTERKALTLKTQDIELAKQQVNLQAILLEKAQQNLEYTNINIPFDAFVISKSVGPGSTVTTNTNIATIVAVDYYWIEATIPVSQLSSIHIPINSKEQGSSVKISHRSWANVFRTGKVARLLPQIEPEGKMARILIKVEDPLLRLQKKADKPVLLLGSFVRLQIEGRILKNVIQIPREHIHDGKFVWIFANNSLQKRAVNIVWREKDDVFIDSGISTGEKMIVSQIPGAVTGMTVKEIQQ